MRPAPGPGRAARTPAGPAVASGPRPDAARPGTTPGPATAHPRDAPRVPTRRPLPQATAAGTAEVAYPGRMPKSVRTQRAARRPEKRAPWTVAVSRWAPQT